MISEIAQTALEASVSKAECFKSILPEMKTSVAEANAGLAKEIPTPSEIMKPESYEEHRIKERIKDSPGDSSALGFWTGDRGNSLFVPDSNRDDALGATKLLKEKGLKGIEYRNGEPDFSPFSESTVKIDNMTEHRSDYYDDNGNKCEGNFTQADKNCAKQWNLEDRGNINTWTEESVATWRKENGYSWHERCDMRTMDLVPTSINEYFKHSGGVSECKALNRTFEGGIFDE